MRHTPWLFAAVSLLAAAPPADPPLTPADEAVIFTPPGFDAVGKPVTAQGPTSGRLAVRVLDESGKPTACRLNVVGPDGQFYQPAANRLSADSLTGEWPKSGRGNRTGKGPVRYLGRYFYTTGEVELGVPAGRVRVEVWKGLEYRPESVTVTTAAGQTRRAEVHLRRAADLRSLGYDAGDTHLHFPRASDDDENRVFDLLDAEGVRFGAVLGYNEPAGPYHAVREKLDYPPLRGLGAASIKRRGTTQILSGQEYRSSTYGHLNLFLRDDLVNEGQDYNADRWPTYGRVGRETLARGGYAVHAHGGYAQSIYADFARGDVSAVELLQFGVYRGIGLDDWYHILNAGYRFPCVGASDFPACRKLADCVTYVRTDPANSPDFPTWLRGAAGGRSFVTTGPLLLLEVDGHHPGAVLGRKGAGPHRLKARVRLLSAVTPVTDLQLVVNGRIVASWTVEPGEGRESWFEATSDLNLTTSSWVAARAFGRALTGGPDAESHTNPVYVHLDGRAPFVRKSLDTLLSRLDGQMEAQRKRSFPEKARVLDDYQASRDVLLRVRAEGGLPASGVPKEWLAAGGEGAEAFDPSRRTHTDAELAAFLAPTLPLTPETAIKTFDTADDYSMQLVAAEPLLRSPVAAAYDEDGNLYVAEMTDYPFRPRPGQTPLGSVRLLRDTDGDGKMDQSHVFADGLLWAAGIAPWKGGVFVASPPDIWYFKDTDGDHRADVRRRVFTGFGTQNEQGILNNLTWGLDHRIYGSSSVNGGQVRRADRPDGPAVSFDGRDFRIDPVTETIEPVTGSVQFGTTFDDYGERFLCSESRPLVHAVLPLGALARNPDLAVSSALENVSGNPVPIFRLSQPERWRQIRSSRRIAYGERSADSAGASHHVVDAAAGVTVYRGGAYPSGVRGQVFVCDAQNNLIHRMRLVPDGPTFRAERVDSGSEFVRSYDNWFRPVNLVNAPDGTLHVLDMSREIIEAIHIPLDVMKHLDLRRGRDQGRIYRITPPGFVYQAPPKLSRATTTELVAALAHADAWRRDTSRRLLYERQDRAAVEPLRALATRAPNPVTRVEALWSLDGLGSLDQPTTLAALGDQATAVVAQAVRLAESRLGRSHELLDAVARLAGLSDPALRFRVALALGASDDPKAAAALATLARRDAGSRWSRLAVLASSAPHASAMLKGLAVPGPFAASPHGVEMLSSLATVVGSRGRASEIAASLDTMADADLGKASPGVVRQLVVSLGRGRRQGGGRLDVPERPESPGQRLLAGMARAAADDAENAARPEPRRLEAVTFLGVLSPAFGRTTLIGLLTPESSGPLQAAAVRALSDDPDDAVADALLQRLASLGPVARGAAVEILLSRAAWARRWLDAAMKGEAEAALVDGPRRAALLADTDPEVARRARVVFQTFAPGGDPVEKALPALKLAADPARGASVFEKNCQTCHRMGDRGHAVGPDLTTSAFGEPAALLTHVVDPNRYVAPNYVQYVVADDNGRVATGLIAAETATSLTLRRAGGEEETILRRRVEAIRATGKSLMPDDFGSKLSRQELADLVAYVTGARASRPGGEKLDIGTLPGLVEPEGRSGAPE